MAFKINWEPEAQENFKRIVEYLQSEWSEKSAENFIKNVTVKLNLLSDYPYIGTSKGKNKKIRKIILTQQNTLYYQVSFRQIFILRIFDTRQNPRKLKLRKSK